jgi:hypothetical protein
MLQYNLVWTSFNFVQKQNKITAWIFIFSTKELGCVAIKSSELTNRIAPSLACIEQRKCAYEVQGTLLLVRVYTVTCLWGIKSSLNNIIKAMLLLTKCKAFRDKQGRPFSRIRPVYFAHPTSEWKRCSRYDNDHLSGYGCTGLRISGSVVSLVRVSFPGESLIPLWITVLLPTLRLVKKSHV